MNFQQHREKLLNGRFAELFFAFYRARKAAA
jgi:hypothetical protein